MTMRSISRRLDRETGASAVEYALIVAAIAALIVLVVFVLGTLTRANVKSACDNWGSADSTGAC